MCPTAFNSLMAFLFYYISQSGTSNFSHFLTWAPLVFVILPVLFSRYWGDPWQGSALHDPISCGIVSSVFYQFPVTRA